MEIEICGYRVIIDDDDWDKVKMYRWHVDQVYLRRSGNYYFRTRPYKNG